MSWVDKKAWRSWLDETGYDFNIPAFYYDDDKARFQVVTVALWLEHWPEAMQSFLSRFKPDADDIKHANRAYFEAHGDTALRVLREWIAGEDAK